MLYYNKRRSLITDIRMATHHHHHPPGHAHPPATLSPSLMRLSALQRLAGAAVLVVLIWSAVLWAMG